MSHRNASGTKQEDTEEQPIAHGETEELLIVAEDGYRNTTSAMRRRIFSILQEERDALEARKYVMEGNLNLAKRRLEAHNRMSSTSELPASDPCAWLSGPGDIAEMRDRLRKASEDEQLILPIVEEPQEVEVLDLDGYAYNERRDASDRVGLAHFVCRDAALKNCDEVI
ncbi:hypothetical protein FGB62_98g058 [Gracilaria domingensis]|nr:hypothetical protein FGB62_98g058 [Gracilaria domingensis]